jgi:SAM-dependent methyltransferase
MYSYDAIGSNYDVTRQADPGLVDSLVRLLDTQPGALILDVACGTGNYTVALAERGLRMTGVDISSTMLRRAREKFDGVDWRIADASQLPCADGMFAGAVCVLAVHHFSCPAQVFSEVRRVLAGGPLVIFTSSPEQMRRYWLNLYFPQTMARAIAQMPDPQVLAQNLRQAGFRSVDCEPYEVSDSLEDLFLYSGKLRPSLYLDPHVRSGISTFATLAEPSEVEAGLVALAADIASNRIRAVIDAYAHSEGDYQFIIAR